MKFWGGIFKTLAVFLLIFGAVFAAVVLVGVKKWHWQPAQWFSGHPKITETARESQRRQALQPGGGVFDQEKKVLQVGLETLYGRDLNYHLLLFYPEFLDRQEVPPAEVLDQLISGLTEESLVLQEAAKEGAVTLTDTIFNTVNKDYAARNRLYEEAKRILTQKVEERITVEGLFMYFNNQVPPAMGVERAKNLTKLKMDELRKRLVRGELTFETAAEAIRADSSLSTIDPIWGANAAATFDGRNRTLPISGEANSEINQVVWDLGEGEISPVLLGWETGNNGTAANEAYWGVFRVKTRQKGQGVTLVSWLEAQKQNYEITRYL